MSKRKTKLVKKQEIIKNENWLKINYYNIKIIKNNRKIINE